MLVEIGHEAPHGLAVTYVHVPDEVYPSLGEADPLTAGQVALHLQRNPQITHLPGYEAFVALVQQDGALAAQGVLRPTWVRSTDPVFEALFADFHEVPRGAPGNLEDTHWTKYGTSVYPPGAIPDPAAGITALLTNAGRDILDANMWSGLGAATVLGLTGTATATGTTSLTGGTESGSPSHASNDAAGQVLVAWSNGAYTIVQSNTTGTTPVYTGDRWYTPSSPGGSAATTPGSTTGYSLLPGGPPAIFMAISANASAVNMTDTTLPGEITTGTGDSGLIRKIGVVAHTAGANTTTLTAVFTASGVGGGLPVTVAKMAIGPSIVATYKNALQTLLTATATLNIAGDQLTITDTMTSS